MGILKNILNGLVPMGKPKEAGLSAEEKELESYMKEEKRDALKKLLAKYRNKKMKEFWQGATLGGTGKGNILQAEETLLKNGKSLLKQKNMFL